MGNSSNKQIDYESLSSSNSIPSRHCILNEESIDEFIFIWLDNNALENSLDSLRTKTLLRQLNNNNQCLFFDNIQSFIYKIEQLKTENKKILLIISGFFAKEILSQITEIISSIIIFCRNSTKYNYLMKQYSNIIDIFNQAFRTEDILLWYLFRFYITDLCTQLEYIHRQQNYQSILKLYRGQHRLPKKELENLKLNIGGFISTNGFFSTSKDFDIARKFIFGATDTEDFKVVLFEIIVDAKNLKNIIFVDIDQYRQQLGESEVLFNIGSVFQVENVIYDDNLNVWKIKMKATDEGTDSIQKRIQLIKQKFRNGNINLLFGRLLLDMNQYTKAESYFRMILNNLPKSHYDIALIYDSIGDLNMRISYWNEAFKNYNLAYEIKKKKLHLNHQDIAVTLNNLGNYYKSIRYYYKALEYYSQVLTCKTNQYNRAVTLLNMSTIYFIKHDYDQALNLCLDARDIIQEFAPNSYIGLIQCHGIMGNIYLTQQDYHSAKEFYLTAFELSKKTLFIDDRHQIICIKALANLYQQQAIDFCLEQFNFYEQNLTENHFNIAQLLINISELYEDYQEEKLEYLERALKILQENIHLQYDTTANCFKLIGQYYQKHNLTNKAIMFYMRTLEIQKKIYPENHFILNETQCLIDDIED